jgi:hypothetical protein
MIILIICENPEMGDKIKYILHTGWYSILFCFLSEPQQWRSGILYAGSLTQSLLHPTTPLPQTSTTRLKSSLTAFTRTNDVFVVG